MNHKQHLQHWLPNLVCLLWGMFYPARRAPFFPALRKNFIYKEGIRHETLTRRSRVLILFAALAVASTAYAHDPGGTISGVYNEQDWEIITTPGEASGGNVLYSFTMSGSRTDYPSAYVIAHIIWDSGSENHHVESGETLSIPTGTDFTVQAGVIIPSVIGHGHPNEMGTTWGIGNAATYTSTGSAPTTYFITFGIPAVPAASAGGTLVRYEFRNEEGETVATHEAIPGDAATEVEIGPLDDDSDITMFRVEGETVTFTDANGVIGFIFVPTGLSTLVSGTPTEGSGTAVPAPVLPPVPAPPPITPPEAPEPTTPPPAAPTPPPPVAPPSHPTPPTPTGTGGATKTDIMEAANQITVAVNVVADKVVETGNAELEATNNVVDAVVDGTTAVTEAVDKVTQKIFEASEKAVQGDNRLVDQAVETKGILNAISTKTDGVSARIDALKASVDSQFVKMENIETLLQQEKDRIAAEKTAADGVAATAEATGAAKKAEAESSFNSAVGSIKSHTAEGAGSASKFTLSIPTGREERSIATDPFNGVLGIAFAWVKFIAAVFIAWHFTFWGIGEVQKVLLWAGILGPARGNTVAGSGGQVTSTLVATWITTLLLVAPTTLMALFVDSPANFGSGTISLFGELASSNVGLGAMYFMQNAFPMATLASAMTFYLVIKKGSTAVYLGISAAIRHFTP